LIRSFVRTVFRTLDLSFCLAASIRWRRRVVSNSAMGARAVEMS